MGTGVAVLCERIMENIDEVITSLPIDPAAAAALVADLLGHPPDFNVRDLPTGVQLVFLDSIVNQQRVEEAIIRPLIEGRTGGHFTAAQPAGVSTYGDAVTALLGGNVLVASGSGIVAVSMDHWPKRQPSEPPAEIVPQGPHTGFVEDMEVNMALLRHLIQDRRLRCRRILLGERSPSVTVLVHLEGTARTDTVRHVERRLRAVARAESFATDTEMVAEWLTRISGSLFPTMEATERPDVAAAALHEGRVLVLMDGSPVAVMAPTVFVHLIQAPIDYYNRSFDAWTKRLIRLAALGLSVLASPVFVAVVTVNQELVPARLFVSVAQNSQGVPLPTLMEVLVMEVIVEMVQEAGLRMPGALGQTVSIVGAIVIGQSAVMAGLLSAPVVVVVSLAYIASTAVPSLNARKALRVLRYPLILLGAWLGLFGVMWGLTLLALYLLALESFGTPYLAPIAPRRPRGLQDAIRRIPLTDMRRSFLARRRRMPQ